MNGNGTRTHPQLMPTQLQERDARLAVAAARAINEAQRAQQINAPFNSAHEGYAVLKEEVDEMWDAIKANDREHACEEAVQVAAMALRFLVDLGVKAGTAERAAMERVREAQG